MKQLLWFAITRLILLLGALVALVYGLFGHDLVVILRMTLAMVVALYADMVYREIKEHLSEIVERGAK